MSSWVKEHPFGAGLALFGVLAFIGIVAFAYWKSRAVGEAGMRYWDTDRKRKKQ
jgi:hypothetical protein